MAHGCKQWDRQCYCNTLNDIDVTFQIDTAADVNTIRQRHVRQHQVSPTTVRLNI